MFKLIFVSIEQFEVTLGHIETPRVIRLAKEPNKMLKFESLLVFQKVVQTGKINSISTQVRVAVLDRVAIVRL